MDSGKLKQKMSWIIYHELYNKNIIQGHGPGSLLSFALRAPDVYIVCTSLRAQTEKLIC